ncbi:MAG: tetratricopeptide (TPR) repeat protein [Saprospiraceae bacterium]|jgi:tetratricopeptide (TPR) repeat protein
MNHKYNRKDTKDLLYLYETLSKKGIEVNLLEIDFLNLITHLETGYNLSEAIEVADHGLAKFKFSPLLHTCKARLLIDHGQEELAFESLDRAEVFGQSFIETDILRAKAHLSLNEVKDAQEIIYDLKFSYHTTETERSNILYVEALIHEQEDRYDSMYTCLEEAVGLNPFNEEALQKLYIAVELAKKHEESVVLHNFVLDENPYSHTAWFNLAQAHYFLLAYEEALDAFEYAFITNARFEPAYKEYAEVCFSLKLYQKALDALEDALGYFEADEELLLKIGQCYEYLGKTAKAKIFYYRALNFNDMADEVYFHIGECYSKEGEYTSSLHFYKQAIDIDDLREDYLMALAKSYCQVGRYQKALPLFQKATEMGPELSANWVEYAWFLVKIGGLQEALEAIEEGEENSYGADLYYCKAAILFKMEDRTGALDALGEALMVDFEDKELFFSYLPMYRKDKDVRAIIKYYSVEV